MWVVKTKGESYYVHHVDCSVPWSTKETPGNASTKGSIKIKNCHLIIDEQNNAIISELTQEVKDRLSGKKPPLLIITTAGAQLGAALRNMKLSESKIISFGGGCGTAWYVTELPDDNTFMLLSLTIPNIRRLMPNEVYYKSYLSDEGYVESDWEELYDD
jgi:hypothetical protein